MPSGTIYKNLHTPIIQNMLKLLAAALNDQRDSVSLDLSLWAEIKKELQYQTVFPMVSVVPLNPALPAQEKQELATATAMNVLSFHELMRVQTAVLQLFREHHIAAVVMKGAAAAQYYTTPTLRMYGDIDILVSPRDYRKAFELLCASGYQNRQAYDVHSHRRHIEFMTPENKEVELHRCFSSSLNEKENARLDGWLYDNIQNARSIHVNGYEVPVFPPLENGLILLGHINQHIGRGLGLRQIVDWMLYVRAELTDEFWQEKFQARAEAIGMAHLAKAVTRMCQKYLGLRSQITWCKDVDEKLVDDLMLYIINKGNFGQKIEKDTRYTMSVAHRLANPIQTFRYLTKTGSIRMEKAGLHPSKAYAWMYQLGYLMVKRIRRPSKDTILQEIKCGVKEAELLKRLHVTKIY